jgi:hypothetical protein
MAKLNDQLQDFANFGVLGLMVLAFLTGYLIPGWLYKEKVQENKELRDNIAKFSELIKEVIDKIDKLL